MLAAACNSANNNFGERPPVSSLAGNVYRDINNNCAFDNGLGETGIACLTVTLARTDLHSFPTRRSSDLSATGAYSFVGLNASNATGYTITETQPAAFTDGIDTQ